VSRTLWFGLAAATAGIAFGVVIALQSAQQAAPTLPPQGAIADLRPPEATFDPIFEPCAHCHQIGVGALMTTGPSLQGLIGRRAGQLAGYPFSDAMRDSSIVWDPATLDRFIASPQSIVPGTRMIYAGMDDPEQRKALIDFIAKAGKGD
jgi:cytochrome c